MPRYRIPISMLLVLVLLAATWGSGVPSVRAEVPAPSGVRLVSSTESGVEFTVRVPWEQLSVRPVTVDDKAYEAVTLPDWTVTSQPGAPALPFLTQQIGVPLGMSLQVRVLAAGGHKMALSAPVLPAATQIVDPGLPSQADGSPSEPQVRIAVMPDAAVYDGADAYPAVLAQVTSDGLARDQRVAGIAVYPVQYDPKTLQVTVYESLTIQVRFEGRAPQVDAAPSVEPELAAVEEAFYGALLNRESARRWRGTAAVPLEPKANGTAALPWTPPDPAWRVRVRTPGMYRLTYAELLAAGVLADAPDPRTFRLYNLGQEVAIEVVGESDGSMDDGDSIVFYGQAVESKYTRDNVYWLTYGQGDGLRMGSRDGTPGTGTAPAYYDAALHLETNSIYISNSPGDADLERWFGDYLYPPTRSSTSVPFTVAAPYTGTYTATLRIRMLGLLESSIDPDHHVTAALNGTPVADAYWDGRTWYTIEVPVAQSLLLPGANSVTLTDPYDTGVGLDVVYLDWVELDYANTFIAQNDELAFEYAAAGTWQYPLAGFGTDQVDVYDVTDPHGVVRIAGVSAATFSDTVTTAVRYHALERTAYRTVEGLTQDAPSALSATTNGADYIVVTHADFLAQAQALCDYRQSQGLRTLVVDVQDVYDEFGYGITGTEPLRAFVAYAYQQWVAPRPAYLVLLGDGHYDPKNYAGYGRTSYIPPYLAPVDPWITETAADNRYVAVAGADVFPDLLLGRLAVNNTTQADAIVSKILGYEQSPAAGDWRQQVLAVADNGDSGGNFPTISDAVLSACLPSYVETDKVYHLVTHTTAAASKAALLASLNAGKLLVNYVGHAYTNGWASENLLTTTDVAALTNGDRLPVMLPMTCREGYYHYPHNPASKMDAVAEEITRAAGKGAVASWSPTGLGVASGHDHLNRGFLLELFQDADGRVTLGQATLAGKLRLWGTGRDLDLLDTYLLFGDPAGVITIEQTVERTLPPGWNLVSLPLSPVNDTGPTTQVAEILASIAGSYDAVEYYDPTDTADPWKLYDPSAPAESDLTALTPGQGFWLHMLAEDIWVVRGAPIAGLDIELYAGWNMIGWAFGPADSVTAALNSIAGKYRSVWSYRGDSEAHPWQVYGPEAPEWVNTLAVVESGRGYWIHANEDCTLTLP